VEKHLDKWMDVNEELLLSGFNDLQKIISLFPKFQEKIISGMRNNILKYGVTAEKFKIFNISELQQDPQIIAYMKEVLIRNLTNISRINEILSYFKFRVGDKRITAEIEGIIVDNISHPKIIDVIKYYKYYFEFTPSMKLTKLLKDNGIKIPS